MIQATHFSDAAPGDKSGDASDVLTALVHAKLPTGGGACSGSSARETRARQPITAALWMITSSSGWLSVNIGKHIRPALFSTRDPQRPLVTRIAALQPA